MPPGFLASRWLSPLAADDFAEYRDASFLRLLGLAALAPQLRRSGRAGGRSGMRLGVIGAAPVLVEAKAHLDEFFSPATAARGRAGEDRGGARETRAALGADWMERFYQFTNRLAHLHFLRREGAGDRPHGRPPKACVYRAPQCYPR